MSHLIDLRRLVEAQRKCPAGLARLAKFVDAKDAEPFNVLRACMKAPVGYPPAWLKVTDRRASR